MLFALRNEFFFRSRPMYIVIVCIFILYVLVFEMQYILFTNAYICCYIYI